MVIWSPGDGRRERSEGRVLLTGEGPSSRKQLMGVGLQGIEPRRGWGAGGWLPVFTFKGRFLCSLRASIAHSMKPGLGRILRLLAGGLPTPPPPVLGCPPCLCLQRAWSAPRTAPSPGGALPAAARRLHSGDRQTSVSPVVPAMACLCSPKFVC